MDGFDAAYRARLDAMCHRYEQALKQGEQWALIPYEITKQWLELQSRKQLTAAEAAELVRACDRWQGHESGLPFFAMCNSIRKWYRHIYERELSETFNQNEPTT